MEKGADSKMEKISKDQAHYTRAWSAFREHSDEIAVQDRWIENEFSRQVVDKLAARFRGCEQLRILGVGSGSGEVDLKMALKVGSLLKTRIHNTVVEPAAAQLDMYRHHVAAIKQKHMAIKGLDCIEFDFRQQTIEEFLGEEGNLGAKFHFVSSIESMCHMTNYGDVIELLHSRLEDGGVLVVQLDSDESSWFLPMEVYPQLQDPPDISTTELRKCLDERSIPYEVSRMDIRVDITGCVASDRRQLREESSLVLDIVTMTKNFACSASQELYRGVMELLKSGECTEQGEDGKIYFGDFRESLVIQKV